MAKEEPVFLKEARLVRQYIRDALAYARACSYREEMMGILLEADKRLNEYESGLRKDFSK